MMEIRRALIAVAVMGALGVTELAGAAGPPTGLDVNVVNTNPIPVTGSVTVNGSVTGSVTGTVGLTTGTSVRINNTVGDPVRVRSVNDAIQPIQATKNCRTTTLGCLPTVYTVPAGKRLVIEYASMSACVLPGQAAVFSLTTSVGGEFVAHYFNVTPASASPGTGAIGCNASPSSIVTTGQQVRIYADSGTSIQAEVTRSVVLGTLDADVSISGYLVDLPLSP